MPNDMQRAAKQLRIIWAVERMIRANQSRSDTLTQWLKQYYKDEEVSDRSTIALTY